MFTSRQREEEESLRLVWIFNRGTAAELHQPFSYGNISVPAGK